MPSPKDILDRAIAQAGSDDFGPPSFHEGLERTLDAFARIPLLPGAADSAIDRIVADLANRLRIIAWEKENAEVAQQPVEGPVLVFGLPRTGTTATVAMMALDSRFRFLRGWEAGQPFPPPVSGQEDKDPRVIAAREAAKDYTNQAAHLFDPDGPEEDMVMLAGLDMRSYHGAYPMPDDFIEWWIGADFSSTYAMHEKVLQILHSRRPPYLWLLKAPVHLFQLEAFARQYPTAKFVMTHRDPAKVIPSDASLRHKLHSARCDPAALEKTQYGPKLLDFWRRGMDRALEARARIGEDRFVDVRNTDVIADPLGSFDRVYAGLGMTVTDELRGAIRAYLERNAKGAHGAHKYTAEEYGTSEAAIREAFADYCERFGV